MQKTIRCVLAGGVGWGWVGGVGPGSRARVKEEEQHEQIMSENARPGPNILYATYKGNKSVCFTLKSRTTCLKWEVIP